MKIFDSLIENNDIKVKVVIIKGAVSIYVPVEQGDYAAYTAGTVFDAKGSTKESIPSR